MCIKRLRCKHKNQVCLTNIHGDWRLDWNCMSVWECRDCGKWIKKDFLDPDCEFTNFRKLPEEVLNVRRKVCKIPEPTHFVPMPPIKPAPVRDRDLVKKEDEE